MKLAIFILSVFLFVSIVINVILIVEYYSIIKKFAHLLKRIERYQEMLKMAKDYISEKTKDNKAYLTKE